jgi:predicted RNase H-like nuclease (RuvC/YqgF family)
MNENPARGDMISEIGPTAAALIISACQAERDELKKRVYTLEAATSLAHRPFGARLDPLSVAHAIAALNEQHAIEIETLRAKLDEAKREVERLREEREALRQRLHDMDANET